MPPFGPGAAFLGIDVRRVGWVALHPAPFASGIETLVLKLNEVLGMDVTEVIK